MYSKRALIIGVTGQAGSYLAEVLLEQGYKVWGLVRRSSSFNTGRIEHLYSDPHEEGRFRLVYGDLTDSTSLARIIAEIGPDEVYNLGAMSHVKVSFEMPEYTADVVGVGTLRLLEAIRNDWTPIKFYQASSSEMFGAASPPQNELTKFYPRSPYACAKAMAYYATINYREAYGMFTANGILFNHESSRRGETFVSRKITRAATRIKCGLQKTLYLGNLDARRDWGYAPEYARAMYLIMQHPEPGDFVIATGEQHTVREFVQEAFGMLGLDWEGFVQVDPSYLRPAEVDSLRGDSSKARLVLGWEPKTKFKDLVRIMVEADMKLAEEEVYKSELVISIGKAR